MKMYEMKKKVQSSSQQELKMSPNHDYFVEWCLGYNVDNYPSLSTSLFTLYSAPAPSAPQEGPDNNKITIEFRPGSWHWIYLERGFVRKILLITTGSSTFHTFYIGFFSTFGCRTIFTSSTFQQKLPEEHCIVELTWRCHEKLLQTSYQQTNCCKATCNVFPIKCIRKIHVAAVA